MTTEDEPATPEGVNIVENDIKLTVDTENVDWDHAAEHNLPEGIQVKFLNRDTEARRSDKLIKFPPGYLEPEHTHASVHSTMVVAGRMLVHGHELTPGDYIFGPSGTPHGPMEYPDGCIVFSCSTGGASLSDWEAHDQ